MNLDPLLYASVADIALGGVAIAVVGTAIVRRITEGPLCVSCEEGYHDEQAAVWHRVQKCACACNQERA